MDWSGALELRPGITAVIGGGGKTTLLRTLGQELAGRGRTVLLCTTTRMFPFPGLPCVTQPELEALRAALEQAPLLCAGTMEAETGKLSAPAIPMMRLASLFDHVLVEADGAAGRPMKAHAPYEPVVPPEAGQVICVVGASGFGRPIREAAHRPALYAELAGTAEDAAVAPELEARVLRKEGLHDRVLVNQAELAPEAARALLRVLDCPALAGSLERGERIC